VRSVLSDLTKTGGDFRSLATRALEALSDALLPRLRAALDQVGAVGWALEVAAGGYGSVACV
jgi:hypothetical protein